jgi:hypothetical protein
MYTTRREDDDSTSPATTSKPTRNPRGAKIVSSSSSGSGSSSSCSQVQRGWLFRKEVVEGSEETWRKRWVVLDIETVSVWKNANRTPEALCESVPTHLIREMSFGSALEDRKDFAFMFTTMDDVTTEFSAGTLAGTVTLLFSLLLSHHHASSCFNDNTVHLSFS